MGLPFIRERLAHAGDLLIRLMSFAGNQHHVLCRRLVDRQRDGTGTVEFNLRATVRQTCHHGLHDGLGRLGAWVVAGKHQSIRILLRSTGHVSALTRVAIAAATHHADQFAVARCRQRTQRLQDLRQGVWRVGIVHHHQGLLGCGHHLHATGYRPEIGAHAHGLVQRIPQRAQRGHDAQQVVHVVQPHQGGVQTPGLIALHHVERQSPGMSRCAQFSTALLLNITCPQASRTLRRAAPHLHRQGCA